MKKILGENFFRRPAPIVARNLLGKFLVRKSGKKNYILVITETEAYLGKNDLASHARFGKTKRNAVMFGDGGHWYVYFVYGMHWLLNVVTENKNNPSAVLIRSGILLGKNRKIINGPARITKILKINGRLTGKPVCKKSGLWIEGRGIKAGLVKKSARIGVKYSGEWSQKPLRFDAPDSFVNEIKNNYN